MNLRHTVQSPKHMEDSNGKIDEKQEICVHRNWNRNIHVALATKFMRCVQGREQQRIDKPLDQYVFQNLFYVNIKYFIKTDKLEELGTDAILDYIITFGGWPILGTHKGGNWDEAAYNFEDLMLKITPYKV